MLFVMGKRDGESEQEVSSGGWGQGDSPVGRPLYLCMSALVSRCRSPDTCSFRRPPWCSRRNTSTLPRPRTGTPPPAPPRWPRGRGGRRTPLHNSPNGTTRGLLTAHCTFVELVSSSHLHLHFDLSFVFIFLSSHIKLWCFLQTLRFYYCLPPHEHKI